MENPTANFKTLKTMSRIKWYLLAAVVWFTVFFNIERLDIGGQNTFNLSNITYLMTLVIGIGMFIFPDLGNLRTRYAGLILLVSYIALGLVFWDEWSGRFLTYYVAEVSLLFATFLLMRRASRSLLKFEESVEMFVVDDETSPILETDEGIKRANEEVRRADRFKHPVALVCCSGYSKVPEDKADENDPFAAYLTDPVLRRRQQLQLADAALRLTFKSDVIFTYKDYIIICLPESSIHNTMTFVDSLSRFVNEALNMNLLAGVAMYPKDAERVDELIHRAQANIKVRVPPEFGEDDTIRMGDVLVEMQKRLEIEKNASWVNRLAYQSPSARRLYRPIKRAIDIVAVVGAGLIFLPIGLLVALLIYLDDGGPIFYMQPRTGFGGKRFQMFKFRSMKVGAAAIKPREIRLPNGEIRYEWPEKTEQDKRITRVGRFIRKTSLDELPQLLNILRGDMSLVGPRPTTWDVNMYTLHQTERLRVRPGLTGLWQVAARETKNMDERLLWDLKYVEKMSLYLDIQIILRTVLQVFNKGGV
jgi:lipopolysaccharide/colanic/teichoic acid biosynthesis glycosyltransferase